MQDTTNRRRTHNYKYTVFAKTLAGWDGSEKTKVRARLHNYHEAIQIRDNIAESETCLDVWVEDLDGEIVT